MVVNLIEWSHKLLTAEQNQNGIQPLTQSLENLTVKDAYLIQLETINEKVAQGHRITGKKIGLTSKAMQELLNVDEPDYGHLLSNMEIKDSTTLRSDYLKPRVEAEVAFFLKAPLKGPNVTVAQVIEATDYIVGSLEIVDSRIENWKIKLLDTIADNASSAKYVLGDVKRDAAQVDLPEIEMDFYKNGTKVNTGKGEDVLGNPAACVAWLVNRLADFNIGMEAGEVILSGALSAALDAEVGDVFVADFGELLGKVEVEFK
ncbi:2-keto-4-pentenoate hydratase [Solibacillus sp. R5-41]|uniref:2-keto-4-pentenoate hydratase n=1 Tax=Solibacillus sp. R5-41 TaxID=2048654 RepID=UPI000C1291D2|nr:fumarylacetoacetate hydrolase family protein [Solibacillus sp. R5-41]ATP41190.1 2-keto-4-pentenoate hydratase [Solibacillus sp. R5-41]